MERVGYNRRLLAAVIDVCILLFLYRCIFGLILWVANDSFYTWFYLVNLLGILACLSYAATEIINAASPGKVACGITIKSAEGTPAELDSLTRRAVVKYATLLLALLGAISTLSFFYTLALMAAIIVCMGCLLVLTESRQALHDRAAGTAVYPSENAERSCLNRLLNKLHQAHST